MNIQSEISLNALFKELKTSNNSHIWLDVRTDQEVNNGTILNSLHIELSKLPQQISKLQDHHNKKILCFCRSGARSKEAAEYLRNNGFQNAINVGGYDELKSRF